MNILELPRHTLTRLITKADDVRVPTPFRATDATTALTRGIAEYVSQLSISTLEGRQLQFTKCFDAWAQQEDQATYPSFAAYTNDSDGVYDGANFSPRVGQTRYADGTYEVSSAELAIELKCEIWATDPEERKSLVLMLEEAFQPVEWRYGFVLELPHYFNQRATFGLMKSTYLGGAQEATSGFVNARLFLHASVPVTRVLGFPIAQPKVIVTAQAGDLTVPSGAIVDSGVNL